MSIIGTCKSYWSINALCLLPRVVIAPSSDLEFLIVPSSTYILLPPIHRKLHHRLMVSLNLRPDLEQLLYKGFVIFSGYFI